MYPIISWTENWTRHSVNEYSLILYTIKCPRETKCQDNCRLLHDITCNVDNQEALHEKQNLTIVMNVEFWLATIKARCHPIGRTFSGMYHSKQSIKRRKRNLWLLVIDKSTFLIDLRLTALNRIRCNCKVPS